MTLSIFLIGAMFMTTEAQTKKEKKAAQKAQWEAEQKQKAEEAALLHQLKMDSIKNAQEQRDAKAKQAQEQADAKAKQEQEDAEREQGGIRKPKIGQQLLIMPCMEVAYDYDAEFLAGYGVVEKVPTMTRAIEDANKAAIAELANRFVGVIKNGVQDYSKDTHVPSGQRAYQSQLEGAAQSIGEKAINKLFKTACRDVAQCEGGGYNGYAAIRVKESDAMSEVINQMEVLGVDFDKKKMFDYINAELQSQKQQRQEEMDQMRKMNE